MQAEHWVAHYAPLPVAMTPSITYPSGASVSFHEFAPTLAPLASANAQHRARVIPAIESGDVVRQTLHVYAACDRDFNGCLSWHNGEIRNFIAGVFAQQGLSPPNEQQMWLLFQKFDTDRNGVLDARECLCLVDALLRAIFFSEPPRVPVRMQPPTPAILTPASSFPALHALPQLAAPSAGFVPVSPYPHAALQAAPSWRSAASTLPASEAWREPPWTEALPEAQAEWEEVPAPQLPPDPVPHIPVEDYDAPRRPPGPSPKPPAWQEREQRPHLLEVELDELELLPEAPEFETAWHEWLRYFISFHPRSEQPDAIPLPRDPPRMTRDGTYLVSQIQAARKPGLKLARFWGQASDGEDGQAEGAPAADRPLAEFKEKLELRMPHLDIHLVAYLWARKASVANEEVALIGRALAPLRDFGLQRRQTVWGVFDVMAGDRVADMRVKFSVATTPSSIQQPTLTDVKQDEVTIQWSPPANDHGAPTIGYKVSILTGARRAQGPQWHTLCECTKSTNPIYVVTNLTGNTSYLMDIRAVNKVGVGDPTEFQINTAPVQPEPPSKPWIQEARDGCLNVAWQPSPSDGGSPIVAYKVKMRKIMGASRWNPFGPGESKATWVDMGTVGAALEENIQSEPATYDAWLGPLEAESCEYRFQVVAMSGAGVSVGSDLARGRPLPTGPTPLQAPWGRTAKAVALRRRLQTQRL